jgi:hypothetical protein
VAYLRYLWAVLLIWLGFVKCESHNRHRDRLRGWRRRTEDDDNAWACPRCAKVMCWHCEGAHANDPEIDPLCDDCWAAVMEKRNGKDAGPVHPGEAVQHQGR